VVACRGRDALNMPSRVAIREGRVSEEVAGTSGPESEACSLGTEGTCQLVMTEPSSLTLIGPEMPVLAGTAAHARLLQ
jgi:hypothetical protein